MNVEMSASGVAPSEGGARSCAWTTRRVAGSTIWVLDRRAVKTDLLGREREVSQAKLRRLPGATAMHPLLDRDEDVVSDR